MTSSIRTVRRLRGWLSELWRWLAEVKVVWMGVLVLVAVVAHGCFVWCTESTIRWAGLILQLLGMMFAIRGLLLVRRHFKQPKLMHLVVQWLYRFPKWSRAVRLTGVPAEARAIASMGAVTIWKADDPSLPVEQRIEGIVRNLERLHQEHQSTEVSLNQLRVDHEAHKKSVVEGNKKLEEIMRSDAESAHTGDLLPALVGLVWVTVGITLSTLAPELSTWFGG